MTTAIQDSYSFNAKLKSKGEQRNNDGWTITLDWKLPGSQYDLVLYGRDWGEVEGVGVGDFREWIIRKGNLKQGKDGKYTSDYFWDLEGFDEPPNEPLAEPFVGKPLPDAAQAPQRGSQEPPSDDIQTRIEKGMAFNAAYTLVSAVRGSTGMDYEAAVPRIRWLRDLIYHEVIQMPVAPAHYCYSCEQAFVLGPAGANGSPGRWRHRLGDGWCMEDGNPLPGAQKVPESSPVATAEPPSQELEDTVAEANITWKRFEDTILGCDWAMWISRKGTSDAALKRLKLYQEHQERGDT